VTHRRQLGDRAHELIREAKYLEALAIFDELVECIDLPLQHYCNALWVAQHDNTKLPIDPARSRKYLAACVPFGAANPPIHLNAAGVCVEIGELDAAITNLVLAARGGVDLTPYLDEPLFAPLRTLPRWREVVDGASEVRGPTRLEIAEAAVARGELAHAVPALRLVWRATRAPRIADLLDRLDVACGRRVGYGATWIEQALAEGALELFDQLDHCTRVLRDGKGGYGEKTGIWLIEECDDPRFATGLLRVIAAGPVMPERMKVEQAWASMWSTLVALGDLRVVEPLAALASRFPPDDSPMARRLRAQLASSAEALRAQHTPAPLDDEAAVACARLEAALAAFVPPALDVARLPEVPRVEAVPSHPLEIAHAALARDAFEEATAALVSAWQRVRSPRIADLIDAVDARARRAPLLDEWGEDANSDAERVWSLHGMDDPRVVTLLCRMFDAPPHIAPREAENGVEVFWSAVLDALRDLRDPRALGPMHAFAKRARGLCAAVDREASWNMYEQTPLGGFLEYQLGLVAKELRKETPVLSAAEATACDALEHALAAELAAHASAGEARRGRPAKRRALLAAIAEAPDDAAPRLAYAAWLRTLDNPLDAAHADLILGADADEAELTDRIEDHVLAELAPYVRVTRWERGFPASVELTPDSRLASIVGHIGWSTVVELTVSSWDMYGKELCQLAMHPVMSALRSLSGVSLAGLATLTRGRSLPLVHVGLDVQNVREPRWGTVRDALEHRLPALRTLELIAYPSEGHLELAPLLASRVLARLEHLALTVRTYPRNVPTGWLASFTKLAASPLRELQLCWEGYRARILRDAQRRLGRLVIEHAVTPAHRMGDLVRFAWLLPAAPVTAFTLVDEGPPPTDRALAELRRVLVRFPNLEAVELPSGRDVSARVRELIAILADDDAHAAMRAAEELVPLQAPEARDALGRCLAESSSEDLRFAAANALAGIADASSIPALRRAVVRGAERSGRYAGLILGSLGAHDAADELVALLAHPEPQFAVEAMMMLGSPRCVPTLEALLASSELPVRHAAINALGVLGARRSAGLVRQLLESGTVYDQRLAITALGLIGDARDLDAIDALPRNDAPAARRRALAHALLGGDVRLLVRTIDEWERSEVIDQLVLGISLERLADRVAAPSLELRDAIVRFVADQVNETRARLLDVTSGWWNWPSHRFVLATFERVLARFTER
jgi:uncharacterized protein (TIGR02996 family)